MAQWKQTRNTGCRLGRIRVNPTESKRFGWVSCPADTPPARSASGRLPRRVALRAVVGCDVDPPHWFEGAAFRAILGMGKGKMWLRLAIGRCGFWWRALVECLDWVEKCGGVGRCPAAASVRSFPSPLSVPSPTVQGAPLLLKSCGRKCSKCHANSFRQQRMDAIGLGWTPIAETCRRWASMFSVHSRSFAVSIRTVFYQGPRQRGETRLRERSKKNPFRCRRTHMIEKCARDREARRVGP